jgi:hypothetical protein
LCFFVADERAVGFDDDVVVLAVFDTVALLAPWVKLSDLVKVHKSHIEARNIPQSG